MTKTNKSNNKTKKMSSIDWKKMYQKTLAEKKALQKENQKLKNYETMIYNVWEELYWKDKYGEDVGWKDISNLSQYDEEFVKKEVIDDNF